MSKKQQPAAGAADDVETVHDKAKIEADLADTIETIRADNVEAGLADTVTDDAERNALVEALEASITSLEARVVSLTTAVRPRGAKRDVQGVHDFWDGYEQALHDKAHRADGIAYVGRSGETLYVALHAANERREAQVAEAEADARAAQS
jgi:hypothetical protein